MLIECACCKKETEHQHLHNCAHGIPDLEKTHYETTYDRMQRLESQLAEARAEVERYKAGVEVEGLFDVQYGLNLCSSETHKLDNSVRYGKVRVLIMKLEG